MMAMTPCIIGQGSPDPTGHLRRSVKNRLFYAHRLAWMEVHGPIPDGLHVLHKCDNPPCVNVDHLFLGTIADNNRDCTAKGRRAKGERNGIAKLTEAQVREIKRRLEGGESLLSLGRVYQMNYSTIRSIRDGETWRHVTGGPIRHLQRYGCRRQQLPADAP